MAISHDSVNVLEVKSINCAHQQDFSANFNLGPFDWLVSPVVPIAILYTYKSHNGTPAIALDRLQQALELLLDYYPQLTGRLEIKDNGESVFTRLGTGAQLISAACDQPLDAFKTSDERRISLLDLPGAGGNTLFAPWEGTVEGSCRDPLFTVQHTRFACGSVALGLRVHHIACDAEGTFQLGRHMAELYRGLKNGDMPKLLNNPCIRSYMSGPDTLSQEESIEAMKYEPALFQIVPEPDDEIQSTEPGAPVLSGDLESTNPSDSTPPNVGRVWHFSSKAIDRLKKDATYGNTTWVSTFDALCALLYQRIYKARLQHYSANLIAMSTPDFLCPINFRGPNRLNLPPNYFPSALVCVTTCLSHKTLTSAPLPDIAKEIHDLTRSPDTAAEPIKQSLRWIIAQPDKQRIQSHFRYGTGSLMISQWNKFNMYEGMQFEPGQRPVLVQTPFTPISLMDGLGYFLPSESSGDDKGSGDTTSVVVNMALSKPIWQYLDQDEVLQRYLAM